MGLIGGGGSAPTVVKAPTMPSPNANAIQLARRRTAAAAAMQSGRMSTVLSQGEQTDKLGG